jgi:hypothetical protein
MLGNLLAVRKTILDMQANRVLDVFHGFFVSFSLAITTLEPRAGNKVTVRVRFYDDEKREGLHS